MKIVCVSCRKELGLKDPYDDPSEVSAKCPDCFTKEKQEKERLARELETVGKDGIINLEGGFKGKITTAGKETKQFHLFEINVDGKDFFCHKDVREHFLKYLDNIHDEAVDITMLHSITCSFERPTRKRKGQKGEPPKSEKSDSVQHNCTIRVPKHYARAIFDDKAERCQMLTELLAEASLKTWREEQLKAKEEMADSLSMSGISNQTSSNSLTSKELGDPETKMTGQNGQKTRGKASR